MKSNCDVPGESIIEAEIYTHVVKKNKLGVKSPMEEIQTFRR